MNRVNQKSQLWLSALAMIFILGAGALNGCGGGSDGGGGGGGYNPGGLPVGPGTCTSIGSAIPFTAYNIQIDSANIIGGMDPQTHQQQGQIYVGGSYAAGPFHGTSADGDTISMSIPNVTAGSPFPYYSSNITNATGVIQIAGYVQQQIISQLYGNNNYFYNPTNPNYSPNANYSSVCVSSVALDLGFNPAQSDIYGGYVYLYLNQSNTYAVLYF